MTAREILTEIIVDLMCEHTTLSTGELTTLVMNNPRWKEESRGETFFSVKHECQRLEYQELITSEQINHFTQWTTT